MNNRQRFHNLMNFKPVDRLPNIEWAFWWDKTIARWHSEGLPASLSEPADIRKHLGLDTYLQQWIPAQNPDCPQPPSHGAPIIRTPQEYHNLLPHLYGPHNLDTALLRSWQPQQESGDAVVWLTLEGFFWHPRTLFGIENHFYAFNDHPALMHEMNKRLLDFHLECLDRCSKILTPDFITIAEDMSYNHGPMLSKQMYDDFLLPYYQPLTTELKSRNIRIFIDSDGKVDPLILWLIEASIEGILPLERMAGVDVNKIRSDHPNFLMIGGFDKTVMHLGEQAIRAEFQRVAPAALSGGYIPSVDHQTPPAVSLTDYRLYLKLLKEYSEKQKPACP